MSATDGALVAELREAVGLEAAATTDVETARRAYEAARTRLEELNKSTRLCWAAIEKAAGVRPFGSLAY